MGSHVEIWSRANGFLRTEGVAPMMWNPVAGALGAARFESQEFLRIARLQGAKGSVRVSNRDGGNQDFVPAKEFGPVPDVFVWS